MGEFRRIDMNGCHMHILNIAKHFHKVCEKYQIPYYMIGGTMLGAVRHKGFIPWDDDMDFGVPRKYYNHVLDALERETVEPYRVITFKNANYPLSFIKIEDTTTWIDDPQRAGKEELKLGVNIDIFPLEECSLDVSKIVPFIKRKNVDTIKMVAVFLSFAHESWKTKILHKIISAFYGKKDIAYWLERDKELVDAVNATGHEAFLNFFGIYGKKGIIDKKYYGSPRLYEFEDTMFYGVDNYDPILKQIYGNYMELPPENKRRNHSNEIYEVLK